MESIQQFCRRRPHQHPFTVRLDVDRARYRHGTDNLSVASKIMVFSGSRSHTGSMAAVTAVGRMA